MAEITCLKFHTFTFPDTSNQKGFLLRLGILKAAGSGYSDSGGYQLKGEFRNPGQL